MTDFETFQSELLKKLGYDVVPFEGDCFPKYVLVKDETFHFMDSDANDSCRQLEEVSGNILIRKDKNGFHYCPSKNEQGDLIQYHMRQYHPDYFILWEDDEYTELRYLYDYHLCDGDTFEYFTTDHYFAIKFHKENNSMLRDDNPFIDAFMSKEKDIFHMGVHVFFINDIIVVSDKNDNVFIYDEELNILYEGGGKFAIWENNSQSYIIFPCLGTVYNLADRTEIELPQDEDCDWNSVLTYKNIIVLYETHRYKVEDNSYYDEDGNYWSDDYNEEDIPIRNTTGHIFDSSFKLLRKFNVVGEVKRMKEIGDTIVMIASSSTFKGNETEEYFNVTIPDITRHVGKTNEDFSIPDISFREMDGYEHLHLVIVKTRVSSTSDVIDFTQGVNSKYFEEKNGVYVCTNWREGKYNKIIDCKYDYIKSLPLEDDNNIYYVGLNGRGDDNTFDLYINHKVILQNIPFDKGRSVKVVGNERFIKVTEAEGRTGLIRIGKFIIEPLYKDIEVYINREKYYKNGNELIETFKYLFVVSDGKQYGICSQTGELILPIKYTSIDIDDDFCIVLIRDFIPESDNEEDEQIKNMLEYGVIYEIGYFNEENNIIETEIANFKDGEVLLDDEGDYVWNGNFIYKKEDYNPWSRENYSDDEAMYDALGGEMEAIWNLD